MVPLVVEALHEAHQRGVIYGDRWGDNELIDAERRVHFIDFDVEWHLPVPQPGLLEALEVAVYLLNTLRLTSDRTGMLALTRQQIEPRLNTWGYDMGRLSDFVEGMGRLIWTRTSRPTPGPCPEASTWTLPHRPQSLPDTCSAPVERRSSVSPSPGKLPEVQADRFVNASWGWREVPLPAYFNWSAAHGLHRVEINGHPLLPGHLLHAEDPAVLPRIRAWAEEAGVRIVRVAGHNDFTSPEEAVHRLQLARARFFVDAAEVLGSGLVRPAFRQPPG